MNNYHLIYEKEEKRQRFLKKVFGGSDDHFIFSFKNSTKLVEKVRDISLQPMSFGVIYLNLDDFTVPSLLKVLEKLNSYNEKIEIIFLSSKKSSEKIKKIKKKAGQEYFILTDPIKMIDCEQLVLKALQDKRGHRTLQREDAVLDSGKESPVVRYDIGNVVYDIRDTINTIKTISDYIRNYMLESNPYITKLQDAIYNSCDDFFSLISDLIEYQGPLEKKNIRTHKINVIFDYLEKKYSLLLNMLDIDLTLNFEKEDFITCDVFKVKRILSYLINTTKKELIIDEISSPKIELDFVNKEEEYSFFLRSNNNKITKERLKLMFEPFYYDEDKDHSGLGYIIMKQIIESHKGLIDIKSVAEGIEFVISIPKVKT